jgi:2-polyprenyl-3-methyl-5-hydroxy-6-metoxy-1,4-benzoquinol methylase
MYDATARMDDEGAFYMKPERLKWTPELVVRFWDGFSQTQLVQFSFAKQAGQSLLIAIDHLLPRDGKVLDFGAGDGQLVRLLCERGFFASAYEPSAGRMQNLEEALADIERFDGVIGQTATSRFDLVIMAEVIEHVLDEELDMTLGSLAELTKLGGTLIVTTPNNEDLELGMTYCPVSNMLFHRWQHVRSFTETTLPELLRGYGFDEIVTHRVGFDPAVFLPVDPQSPTALNEDQLPDYIAKLRRNEKALIGSETNLLYVGRRT